MSFFTTFNPPIVGPGLAPARAKGSQFRSSSVIATAKHSAQSTTTHQWKVKEGSLDLKDTLAVVSRRKMMGLTGLSLAMFSISSPDPAEARMTRAEMKNKILEKLRELRERVGVSKPTDKNEEQTSKPEKDSVPQQEFSNEQNMSVYQEDERREGPKPEGVDGKNSALQTENERREESTPQDDNSPFLPFLNLTEVELETFAEANVSG